MRRLALLFVMLFPLGAVAQGVIGQFTTRRISSASPAHYVIITVPYR